MRIGQRITNPGELRTKILLISRAIQQDPGGFPIPGPSDSKEVWAKWTNVHGAEAWTADAAGASEAATLLIRYVAGLDETWSLNYAGKIFEIVSVDDISMRHEYMELKVKRTVPG